MTDGKSETWIEAGFAEIARSGVEGVRVEVLAKNLGVTKGGFYRRFRDRAALLDGMLQTWSEGRIAAIEKQTSLDGASARERLRALITLYSERMNTEGMAVELAIRQWARSDSAAAARSPASMPRGCKNVGQLYRATGLPPEEADAQAFLFYCFIFGQSLLFLERGPAQARAADREVGRETALRSEDRRGRRCRPRPEVIAGSSRALQLLGAFAVIAAALLDPLQAAIAVGGLVGVVLIDAGVHARLAGAFLGIFRIHRGRKDRRSRRRRGRCAAALLGGFLLGLLGRGGRSRGGRGRGGGGGVRTALALRKSFHFWPASVPAVLAAWYFALHSCAVRACAGDIAANAANPDTAIAQSIFVLLEWSS